MRGTVPRSRRHSPAQGAPAVSSVARVPVRILDRLAPGSLPSVGLLVCTTVGLSLLLPGHAAVDPVAGVVVGLAALAFAAAVTPTGRLWWLRLGAVAFAVLIALLVVSTGGPESAYQDLFAALLVSSAVLKRRLPLALDTVVVILAALAPLTYGDPGAAYVTDLAIDVGTWMVVAVVARLLAHQLVGATTDLAESDQRFRLLANDVPAVVYRVALEGDPHLTWMNTQTATILGFPPDALIEDHDLVLERIPPQDRGIYLATRRDARHGPGVVRYRFDRADGTRIWLEDHYAPVVDDDGRAVAVLGVVFDVSGRVAAEQAQADAQEHDRLARVELGRVLAAQRSFVQGISHELRTPLTAVAGFAAVLATRGDALTPEERAHMQDRLLAGTDRLTALVDDLVDIDRLVGDSDQRLEPRPHDLRALLEGAIQSVPTERHTVVVVGDPGVVPVDATVLHRIVRHLVGNAVRHTPAGSTVTCSVDADRHAVRVRVEDDGPGVPPELQGGQLFEPFVQGRGATAHPSPGTGIGLALAATLARSHGGQIWHEVPERGGARFVVVLRSA